MRPITLFCVWLAACGDSATLPGIDMGPPLDADASREASTSDGATRDMGGDATSSDPCFWGSSAGSEGVRNLVGCNGPAATAPGMANQFGGSCTPGAPERTQGSCTFAGARCLFTDRASTGLCTQSCTLAAGAYTSTSGCPRGSRCFDLGGIGGVCFPDCTSGASCLSGVCDSEGACTLPPATTVDGGTDASAQSDASSADAGDASVMDATATDASIDGAATDAGTPDGSVPSDAGDGGPSNG